MDVCFCGWILSTPDTLQHSFYYNSCVNMSVCVRAFSFVWIATLNLFGQLKNGLGQMIERILFWLTNNPAIYFLRIHLNFFCLFLPFCKYPLFFFLSGVIPLTEVIQQGHSFLPVSGATALCLNYSPPKCLKRGFWSLWLWAEGTVWSLHSFL